MPTYRGTLQGVCALALLMAMMAASVAAQESSAVTFTDSAGREIALDAPAERVVAIPIPATASVGAIADSTDPLVGIMPLTRATFAEGLIGRVFPQSLDIPTNITVPGANIFVPNVEAIVALNPDIVIQWGEGGADLVGPLEAAGLTTALYNWGTEERARQLTDMLGAIFANPEAAQQQQAWRAEVAERISVQVPAGERQTAAVVGVMQAGLQVWGSDTIADASIAAAGGVNVGAALNGMAPINAEQLLAWDPDVIFIFGSEGNAPELIYGDPVLSQLTAALERRVYVQPTAASRWGTAGEDDPLYWMWLFGRLYPEAEGFDLRAEFRDWVQMTYAMDLSDDDLDTVLRLAVNAQARDYADLERD